MTPEEQRIAIAEVCGWTVNSDGTWCDKDGYYAPDGCCPNYLHDLNAMHEVRLSLNPLQVHQFVYELARVLDIDVDEPTDPEEMFNFANASAVQRAEAFLRTIGKWKD